VPCVGGDLLEAVGPIVAAPGEHLDLGVGEMDLDAIAVELDLVDPAIAAGRLVDRGCKRGLDKARERRLDADRRGLLALECHFSHQSQRKRQLDVVVTAFVAFDEFLEMDGLQIATQAQLVRHVGGNVLRPLFGGGETDHPDWALKLALKHVHNDGFEFNSFDVGFAVRAAKTPKSSTTM
jgi:hypothetical protein